MSSFIKEVSQIKNITAKKEAIAQGIATKNLASKLSSSLSLLFSSGYLIPITVFLITLKTNEFIPILELFEVFC